MFFKASYSIFCITDPQSSVIFLWVYETTNIFLLKIPPPQKKTIKFRALSIEGLGIYGLKFMH